MDVLLTAERIHARVTELADEIARDYEGRAVLVAINSNDHASDTFEHMEARAREKGFVFPFLHDESQEVAEAYQPARTPEVFLFDSERRLVHLGGRHRQRLVLRQGCEVVQVVVSSSVVWYATGQAAMHTV